MSKKFLITTLISLGVLLAGFLTILIILAVNGFAPLGADIAVRDWAYSIRGEKGDGIYWFFRIITEFGYLYFTIAIILLMGIIWKFRSKTWFFAGTILFSWIIQKIIKTIADRPRPPEDMWWMVESSSSFPSGHSITVACIFVLLAFFIITSPQTKLWVKYLIASISAFAIILVPISRLILGVHYFTDILAGVFLGAFVAVLGILCYKIFIDIREKKNKNNENKDTISPKTI